MAEVDSSVLDLTGEEYSPPHSSDDVDSLPSSDTDSTLDNQDYVSDADREWRESMKQLELLVTIFVIPYFGKYFGRKAAYWGWARFMEWKYPVSIVTANKGLFRAAGAVAAL